MIPDPNIIAITAWNYTDAVYPTNQLVTSLGNDFITSDGKNFNTKEI